KPARTWRVACGRLVSRPYEMPWSVRAQGRLHGCQCPRTMPTAGELSVGAAHEPPGRCDSRVAPTPPRFTPTRHRRVLQEANGLKRVGLRVALNPTCTPAGPCSLLRPY